MLLVLAVSSLIEMTVGTDDKRMFALGEWSIDAAKDVLARQRLYADVANAIAIILAYSRQNDAWLAHQ